MFVLSLREIEKKWAPFRTIRGAFKEGVHFMWRFLQKRKPQLTTFLDLISSAIQGAQFEKALRVKLSYTAV